MYSTQHNNSLVNVTSDVRNKLFDVKQFPLSVGQQKAGNCLVCKNRCDSMKKTTVFFLIINTISSQRAEPFWFCSKKNKHSNK